MDDLKKLLENAGLNGKRRADELHVAFERVYVPIREQDPQKAEELLQAMNKV